MIGKFAPPKNPANAGSTSSIFAVALRKKYLIIINPNKITKLFNQYLWDFFSTNLVIKNKGCTQPEAQLTVYSLACTFLKVVILCVELLPSRHDTLSQLIYS